MKPDPAQPNPSAPPADAGRQADLEAILSLVAGDITTDSLFALRARLEANAETAAELRATERLHQALLDDQPPAHLWDRIVAARQQAAAPASAPARAARIRRMAPLRLTAAAACIAAGLMMAMFGILGLPAAAQPPLDYTALLQTAAASPNEAFLSFIRNHGARRTDRPAVLEQMQRLRIVVPDTLPRGQRFESIWTIDLPDQRGLAVHFAGNPANGASAVFMLFHRPAEGTPMGVHRAGTCAFSCSTGRADGCEEWQLIHLTKPWVCRCLFAPAGMEQSDLEQILSATVPSSEN